VWCTYRTGFGPIRHLPPLSSLPPPLFFLNALAPSSSSDSRGALAQRRGRGRGRGVAGRWCRTGTGSRRHQPHRGCSIRRRCAIVVFACYVE
jgi:hypothetical protein